MKKMTSVFVVVGVLAMSLFAGCSSAKKDETPAAPAAPAATAPAPVNLGAATSGRGR